MVITIPMKKSKDCNCIFSNYCDGEHPQLRRTLQKDTKNEYLLAALNNSRKIRYIEEEKLKRQEKNNKMEQSQKEEHKNIKNVYKCKSMVLNFVQIETEQENNNGFTTKSSEVRQMKKYNKGLKSYCKCLLSIVLPYHINN